MEDSDTRFPTAHLLKTHAEALLKHAHFAEADAEALLKHTHFAEADAEALLKHANIAEADAKAVLNRGTGCGRGEPAARAGGWAEPAWPRE